MYILYTKLAKINNNLSKIQEGIQTSCQYNAENAKTLLVFKKHFDWIFAFSAVTQENFSKQSLKYIYKNQ